MTTTDNLALARPIKYCKQGCGARTRNVNGFCDEHQEKNLDKEYVRARNADPTDKFYKLARWGKFRKMILEQNWQCQKIVGVEQCCAAANIVHHLRSPREYPQGMFDPKNTTAANFTIARSLAQTDRRAYPRADQCVNCNDGGSPSRTLDFMGIAASLLRSRPWPQ